jgi:hypothetical protein
MLEERPRGGGRPLKTFLLLKFESPSSLGICGGVIGGGGRFCIRQAAACDYTSHQTKAWEARPMEAGMYILDEGAMKAYLQPCLPMEDATCLATGKAVLDNGEQTIEAWTAIFCHLREVGTRGDEEVCKDPGLQRFAMAMKTLKDGGTPTSSTHPSNSACPTRTTTTACLSPQLGLGMRAWPTLRSSICLPLSRGSSGHEKWAPCM